MAPILTTPVKRPGRFRRLRRRGWPETAPLIQPHRRNAKEAADAHSGQTNLATADDELSGQRVRRRTPDAQHVCRFVDGKEIRPRPLDGEVVRSGAHTRQSTTGVPACLIGTAALISTSAHYHASEDGAFGLAGRRIPMPTRPLTMRTGMPASNRPGVFSRVGLNQS